MEVVLYIHSHFHRTNHIFNKTFTYNERPKRWLSVNQKLVVCWFWKQILHKFAIPFKLTFANRALANVIDWKMSFTAKRSAKLTLPTMQSTIKVHVPALLKLQTNRPQVLGHPWIITTLAMIYLFAFRLRWRNQFCFLNETIFKRKSHLSELCRTSFETDIIWNRVVNYPHLTTFIYT